MAEHVFLKSFKILEREQIARQKFALIFNQEVMTGYSQTLVHYDM